MNRCLPLGKGLFTAMKRSSSKYSDLARTSARGLVAARRFMLIRFVSDGAEIKRYLI